MPEEKPAKILRHHVGLRCGKSGCFLRSSDAERLRLGLPLWDSLALLQGSFGPFGSKVAKKVRNEFPGPLSPGGPKSWKQSRKRLKIDYLSTILTLFRLCFGLFGPPGPRGPGNSFRTLFATLGPKGPNDPCSRAREFRNSRCGLACDASARDAKSLAMWVERCEPRARTHLGVQRGTRFY